MRISCAVLALLVAGASRAGDDYAVDVRASTYAQLTRQPLLTGAGTAAGQTQGVASVYGYAFLRVTGVDTPLGRDGLTGELSAWGALGAPPGPIGQVGDGDLQSAWLQHASPRWRLKLGRQVTLPGAARYVRFDGASGAVRLGPVEVEAYAGLATLPRFGRARGYFALGSVADALKDPTLLEVQARPGQWLAGARAAWVGGPGLRAALAFHEQHGAEGLAFRNVAADVRGSVNASVAAGGRVVLDLSALKPAEARLFVDLTRLERLPVFVDYAYAAPALLLPASSVLAAFGGAAWHELGAEATWRASPFLTLTGRAAGQLYEGSGPGLRGVVRAQWTPDVDERWTLIGEYARTAAVTNGYHHLRGAARWRASQDVFTSMDLGAYLYDVEVRGVRASLTGIANVEYVALPQLRVLVSGALLSSPFAAVEGQVLGRLVFELDRPSAGGGS